MDLIIGGAFQGKTAYAKEHYGFSDGEIFTCTAEMGADFSRPCVRRLEQYALFCLRRGLVPEQEILTRREEWKQAVLICDDISCGVVPMEAETRAWREATGRMLAVLSREAATVTRLFCGLPQRLK